ncbi:MAG: putative sulfate exporter family transporter [Sinobacteraceae bacterium]|nr:putative sulfate exporter family transporter [Nevskiaceae bacterium]
MATEAQATRAALHRSSPWKELLQKEDWWAVWLGLGLTVVAVGLFLQGSSIKWLAVTPKKWQDVAQALADLRANAGRYLALFAVWAGLLSIGARALGWRVRQFLPAFALLYGLSILIFTLGQWSEADHYNLEPPLVALLLGLLIANTNLLPRWMDAGFRVEYYVKTGIVLLGATLPFTLIIWAGPVAILQASIISLLTFGVIYFVAVRLGLERRLAATLGAGGAICGVSGAIAIAGAVGARKQDAPVAITLVIFWAIIMIFALPLVARALGLPTGVAGAWIGTSEFADAAGLAAAQAYAGYAGHVPQVSGSPDAAVTAFTLMKVIGRDVWIGIWAFILSIVATARWEQTGVQRRADAGEIWRRFPKFVVGFLLASLLITAVTASASYAQFKSGYTPDLVGPMKNLRTWAFIFCFLSIGLTTRLRELAGAGWKPFVAFTSGVVINVVLGFVLSAVIFYSYWSHL